MTQGWFANPPSWAILPGVGLHVAGGVALGTLYFGALWWSARHFADRGHLATIATLAVARFAVLGGALTLVSLQGAPALLATAAGVLAARFAVMRRVSVAAP